MFWCRGSSAWESTRLDPTKGEAEDRVDHAYTKRRPSRGFKISAKNAEEFPALGTNLSWVNSDSVQLVSLSGEKEEPLR